MADPAPGTPGPGERNTAPPAEGLLDTLSAIWRDLPGLVSDRVELLSLELQRAARALVQIVVLVVAAAILGVTAWLLLWAGIVGALVAAGLALHWALLAAVMLNLVAVALAAQRLKRLVPLLRLPATRRHLTLSPSTAPARHERHDEHGAAAGQPAAR